MELKIGQNIKKLRLSRGMTQEQLADLLCISTAAVSKWEAKNTYPDITLLLPLANIFGVSVDELMGHDAQREEKEIEQLLKEVRTHEINGRFEEAKTLITLARKTYPHDFRIMRSYMWRLVGGESVCDQNLMLEHQEEILRMCDSILDGCKEEPIRLDALNMKAKMFYAAGNTDEALNVLDGFPKSFQTSLFQKERLFEKGSDDYCYWNKRNLYGLLDVTAHKAVHKLWYDSSYSLDQRIKLIEELGDSMTSMRLKDPMFAIPEQMIFAELANLLSCDKCVDVIIRIRRKQFEAMKAIRQLATEDAILKECLILTYKTDNPVKWLYEWLCHASHVQFVRLRQNKMYCNMLAEYENA